MKKASDNDKHYLAFLHGKKAMMVGQLFIYVLSLFVFASVMLFGFNSIRSLMEKGEQTQFVKFKSDLENEIRSISSQYGDVKYFNSRNQMRIPGTFQKVCFIDTDTTENLIQTAKICSPQNLWYDPIICDSWKTIPKQKQQRISGPYQNVFLVPQGASPVILDEKIKIDGNNDGNPDQLGELCLSVIQNRIDFRLEGKGTFVLISPLQ